jgi:predicted DNA-binding protein (UPF0251 family)
MATIAVAINELGRRIGQDHHNAKLTNGEVEMIRQMREDGMTYTEIANKMEIGRRTVRDIVHGRRRAQYPVEFKQVRVRD